MRCETKVGTEKRKRLIGVSLNAINYRHGTCGEITYFKHRAKRVNQDRDSLRGNIDSILNSGD